jgi:PAS domain S-box-containing protein
MLTGHQKGILIPQWMRYGLATGLFGVAFACRFALLPAEEGLALLTFYPGLTVAFLLCGNGPGALYTLLSAVAGFYVFIPPFWELGHNGPGELVTALFLLSASLHAVLVLRVNRAFEVAERNQSLADNLYTATPAMLHSIDVKGRLTKVSDLWLQTLGYERQEVLGRPSSDFLTPESQDFAKSIVLPRFFKTGAVSDVQYQMVCKDGRILDVRISATLERDKQGQPSHSLASILDVTEKKKIEAALQASQQQLEQIFEAAPYGMLAIGLGGKIVRANTAMLALFGWSAQELIGKTLDILLPPRVRHEHDELVTGFLQRSEARAMGNGGDLYGVHKDGHEIQVEIGLSPSGLGPNAEIQVVASVVDVTQRKFTDQALAASEARYKALVEDQTELVSLSTPDGVLRFVNEAYAKHYGTSAAQMVGTSLYAYIPESEREAVVQHLKSSILARQSTFGVNGTVAADGSTRWVAWTNRVVSDVDGVGVLLHSVGRDVTEQRASDLALTQSQAALAELNVRLEQRTTEAEIASASKGQFLANMSHEIRTPMNAILGLLNLLQNTDLTSQQRDYASKTEGAAQSLLGLLNDILDFSKVEAGKMTLESEPFRIDTLMRNLSVVLSANVGNKKIEVLFDIGPDLPEVVRGDAMRLQQVLINLGGNAVKFTTQGQVVLALRKLAQTGDAVTIEFSVQDTGIGIAPEHQAHIFSGFSQAEGSTTRRFGGTGLGLAISKRFVEMMGGDIQISSKPGDGSTFTFTLELPTVSVVSPKLAVPERHTLPAQRVLVVDDNRIAGELTLRMVRSWGWSADLAQSGTQALDMVEAGCTADPAAYPYPVIYMGSQLSDMDGWDAAGSIRKLAQQRRIAQPTIIMLATHGREILAQRTLDEQNLLNGFLVKPVTASMLYEALMEAGSGNSGLRTAAKGRSNARQLRGMRVLVVEDNLINQQVADELLSAEGAIVSLAANGQIAVDAVAAAAPQFDVVLMDVQMPVLDGYGATKAIREELGLARLPIIAMTANAMASDRDTCIAAGMNEHVGKPFDMAKLVSLLIRITKFESVAEPELQVSDKVHLALPEVVGLDPDGHSKCSTYGQSNCSTPVTVN